MPHMHKSSSKFTYVHDERNDASFQAVDVHHILVRRSYTRDIMLYSIFLVLAVNTFCTFSEKEKPRTSLHWNLLLVVFLAASFRCNSIKKESVVIMTAFGVQLETHYRSGRILRRFVPVGKILKPVLNECVTPVTCYWSLALVLQGETELALVFQEIRPPVKMLVPVWKALCAAIDSEGDSEPVTEAIC